jgi:hypothetical protein
MEPGTAWRRKDEQSLFLNDLTGWTAGQHNRFIRQPTTAASPQLSLYRMKFREYKLYQNYPNLFNPVTKIRFSFLRRRGA